MVLLKSSFAVQQKLQRSLRVFLGIVAILITIGILFIYSSSSVFALEKFGSAHFFVKKQLYGLGLGLLGLFIFRVIPMNVIKRWSPFLFLGALTLTAATLFVPFGVKIHGSSRWLSLGAFSFQPSELMKMTFVIYIAYFLSKKGRHLSSFKNGYLPFLIPLALCCIVLLKQPDFGMAVTVALTAFILFFMVQFSLRQLFITVFTLIPLGLVLIYWYPYRIKRILTFLNPWNDPQGAGFQIIQSLIAIGSGGLFGVGIGASKQKFFYLPMQHTDFIFAIIAEETGFVGSTVVIALYIFFLYLGIKIAWHLSDPFCSLLTFGFVLMTSLQALMNLAVVTGLVPTKGIGLPFISAGNSALICSLCFIGLIMNCVHEQRS